MAGPQWIARLVAFPQFPDEDIHRNARIIYSVALAILVGICLVILYRLFAGYPRLLEMMGSMAGAMFLTLILTRRGHTSWAASLLLWSLLAFLVILAVTNDGLHDSALFAIPGLLIVAGLILQRIYFSVFTAITLAMVFLIGALELSGILKNPYSASTRMLDMADLIVIMGITALTIRLMTTNLYAHLHRARISEREARQHAERSELSETRYRLLFNSASDAVMVHGFDERGMPGKFTEVNDIACERLGYTREELLGMSPLDIDAPETVPSIPAIMDRLRAEKSAVWEGIHRTRDGRRIHVEINNHLFQFNGQPTIIAIVRDITERKRADEELKATLREKEVLLREIHHRVKNNMQVISSLLSLASSRVKDPATRQHFLDSMQRIHSMALVHEKLYRSGNLATIDFGDYLSSVTEQLMRSSGRPSVTCEVQAEKIALSVDIAVPCGLIVNELVTNALKHAFPGRSEGKVVVSLERVEPTLVEMAVRDNGVGFPEGFDVREAPSMGLNLVVSLVGQISGKVDLWREGGTTFVIRFPA